MLKVNVRNDWKEFLEKDLVGYGLRYDVPVIRKQPTSMAECKETHSPTC